MNHYSASYDVDMAKAYGLEAAALFNKLVYLSRYSSRDDGFCWKTAKELEDELGISKFQQDRAVKILEKAGLIETKVTYIAGTLTRCKHFKVNGDYSFSESKETSLSIESKETLLSEDKETSLSYSNIYNTNNLNNNHTSNNNIDISKPKIKKVRFGEYHHVLLSQAEYDKLCNDYGQAIADSYIKKVDEYCEMSGKSYKNYNLAIRNTFMKRDNVKPLNQSTDGLTLGADGWYYDKNGDRYI